MGDVKKSAFLAVLATAIVTGRTFGGTFSDDFSTGLNPADWSIVNTDSSAYTVSAPGGNSGVTLANTGGVPSGPVQGVSIVLNLAALGGNITGDFSAQIDFSNWAITPPTDSGDEEANLDTNYSNGGIWDVIRDEETGGYQTTLISGRASSRLRLAQRRRRARSPSPAPVVHWSVISMAQK